MATGWEDLLIVANCKLNWKEFAEHMIYVCPSETDDFHTKYKHFRAKYFAPYVSQGCKYVAQIDGVVRLKSRTEAEIVWNNSEQEDRALELQAIAKLQQVASNRPPVLIFLLSGAKQTDLVFDSKGALLASRQYFDVSGLDVHDVPSLSAKLRETPWSGLLKFAGNEKEPAKAKS